MSAKTPDPTPKALVAVFDDEQTALAVVAHLDQAGFPQKRVGLINREVRTGVSGVTTPKVHETTESKAESGAVKGAGIGVGVAAGFGAAMTLMGAAPAVTIGAMIYAGLTGAFIGAAGGADSADLDDSVNLPTPEEYQRLLDQNKCLVVVGGTHAELMKAEAIVKGLPHASTHLHRLHGHLFHEHPLPSEEKRLPR